MKKQSIAINNLAIMIKKGFDGVNTRLDKIDNRLKHIEIKIDSIEK